MIRYEYKCGYCEQITEIQAPIGQATDTVHCEVCRGTAERIISLNDMPWKTPTATNNGKGEWK